MIVFELREIRKQNKLSIRDLARKSGVSRSEICRIENGYASPCIDTLDSIAQALKLEVTDLYKRVCLCDL